MRKSFLSFMILTMSLLSLPLFSQTGSQTEADTALLGLPGDNLDLYAVLDLFQKSKTIEDFEKSLNLQETGINNLDLNLDNKVDFIKVVTKQDGNDFTFILQVDVSEKEIQDVAVILVSKDKEGKVTMQIVGDKDLYGKDYVIEPKAAATPSVTANPGYTGPEPVAVSTPASTVVVVESAPIVQYVYSPVYVPYYPPYTYAYHPPYFAAFTVMAIGAYHHNNYYHHGGYYGGHGGNVVIHNDVNFNNYNNIRNSSNTVNHNNASGNYNRNNASARPTAGTSASSRPSAGTSASTRPSTGTSASTRPSAGTSASTRPSAGKSASTRPSTGTSASTRPSTSNYSSSSASRSMGSSSYGGGASRSGGYSGGGASRGGGGGGRRR
jgi:uncharacterized membrane protein YgcG